MTPHEKAALRKMIADLVSLAEQCGEAEYRLNVECSVSITAAAELAREALDAAEGNVLAYIESIK